MSRAAEAKPLKILDMASTRFGVSRPSLKDFKGAVEAIDPQGLLAAAGEGESLRVVKLSDGNQVSSLTGHGHSGVFPIASADGKQLMLQ